MPKAFLIIFLLSPFLSLSFCLDSSQRRPSMSTAVVMKKMRTEEMRENPGQQHLFTQSYIALHNAAETPPEDFNFNVTDI